MSKHVNKKKRNSFVVLYKSGTIISFHLIEWNFINNFIYIMRFKFLVWSVLRPPKQRVVNCFFILFISNRFLRHLIFQMEKELLLIEKQILVIKLFNIFIFQNSSN